MRQDMEERNMETLAVQKAEIRKKLSILPEERMQQVVDFVEFMLSQSQVEHKKIMKLGGIWKNLGFEKIEDLEGEIREIRHEASNAMLNKNW
jgi:hypothetical protein